MKSPSRIISLNLLIILYFMIQPVTANSAPSTQSTIIYKYFDANGVLHLTNKPPKNNEQVLYARSYLIKQNLHKHYKYDDYAPLIEAIAYNTRLSPALLHAIVQVESAYNPTAVSPKGAVGLMQLMPAIAKRYGVTDRTDPVANLNGGAQYLRDLLTMFQENLSLALAAYNAGENAVKRYGNTIPPYPETRNYVKKVTKLYYQYLLNQ